MPPPFREDTHHAVEVKDSTAVVLGSWDATNADELRVALMRETKGGSRPVTVDLSGVTHLGSAPVRVLHELATGATPPQLVAAPGSVAHHVLNLVQLPHSTG